MNATMTLAHRKDRLLLERFHDPYKAKRKPREPSLCPDCHAVFREGRWQWAKSWPANSHRELCQACRRIRDNCPAGIVRLCGDLLRTHKVELLNLVRNCEHDENPDHPLHRIMKIEEGMHTLSIQTTDIHLPRRIGEALRRAFKGELTQRYENGSCLVSVKWSRQKVKAR